ncbi:MAG: zinc ribbon domain-containing protein [Sulfurovum sp. AS07-7]|nr:MAG: zinc ribbon domain-containing protein [Sulfurovum sp. AS07-7]
MNKNLKELIELSRLDKAIDDFIPIIENAKKKINRIIASRESLKATIDTLNKDIDNTQAKVEESEEQLSVQNEKLQQNRQKTDNIKSERELKALSLEEQLSKEKVTFAHEEIVRLQSVISIKERTLSETQAQFDSLNTQIDELSIDLNKRLEEIDSKRTQIYNQREELIRTLDKKVLSFYEKIRIWAKNSAVVPVKKQACYGCFMKINDHTYAEVIKAEDITTCPHCGRILYIEPQEA